jgi:hypothetical protein
MKTRTLVIAIMVLMLATGSAFAQMGGPMPGPMPGPGPGPGPGTGHMGGGMGSGMAGAGGMVQGMMANTLSYGYLDVLNPIDTPDEARAAVQAFINASNSGLQISELWEYGTMYKAEIMDTKGVMAFDLIADKFTGAVMPEMGMSMMLNASYGKGMYKTPAFGKNLTVTPAQATAYAQVFMNNNSLGYTLGTPETYPGYYKFHTTDGSAPGMDIMVNGYNGEVWMNTLFGLPHGRVPLPH